MTLDQCNNNRPRNTCTVICPAKLSTLFRFLAYFAIPSIWLGCRIQPSLKTCSLVVIQKYVDCILVIITLDDRLKCNKKHFSSRTHRFPFSVRKFSLFDWIDSVASHSVKGNRYWLRPRSNTRLTSYLKVYIPTGANSDKIAVSFFWYNLVHVGTTNRKSNIQ